MTQRRRFLNKINERVRSITKRTGADRDDILAKIDNIDGAYVTDYGTVNIDPDFFNDEIMEKIESVVPTYTQAKEQALKPYEDYIGPLSEKQINEEIKAMFSYEDDVEELVKEYYELDASLKPWQKATAEFKEVTNKLSELGKQWRDELPFSQLSDVLTDIKNLKGWS